MAARPEAWQKFGGICVSDRVQEDVLSREIVRHSQRIQAVLEKANVK